MTCVLTLVIRWGLFILCVLLIGALCTSYYLQIKRIRAVHETVVSIFAGMVVGLIIRLSPGHLIREMLVSFLTTLLLREDVELIYKVIQTYPFLQSLTTANHPEFRIRVEAGKLPNSSVLRELTG